MKHFDKFKSHIRQENSELPDGFGWEDMEDGIFAKIGAEPVATTRTKKPYFMFFMVGLISAIGILSISYFLAQTAKPTVPQHFKNKNTDEITHHIHNQSLINQSTPSAKNSVIEEAVLKVDENSKSQATFEPNVQNHDSNYSRLPQGKTTPLNDELTTDYALKNSAIENDSKTLFNPFGFEENSTTQSFDIENQNQGNQIEESDGKLIASESKDSPLSNSISKDIPTDDMKVETDIASNQRPSFLFPMLDTRVNFVATTNDALEFAKMSLDVNPLIKKHQRALWSLELASGFNNWDYVFENDLEPPSLYSNTQSEYGYSYSVRLERNLTRRLSLNSGIDMDMMYKKLVVKDTHLQERLVKGALLKYTKNAISGEVSNHMYGDTIVQDTVYKTKTDYNKFQVISIPVILNYNVLNTNSWSIDVGIGPSISFLSNYKGKYLNNGELVSYDKSSNLYSTSSKLALIANLNLKRWISKSYYLGMRLDFKNHFSSWGNQTESKIKPRMIRGSVVIGRSF